MKTGMKLCLKFLEFLALCCLCFLSSSYAWTSYDFGPIQMQRSLGAVRPLQTHTVDSISRPEFGSLFGVAKRKSQESSFLKTENNTEEHPVTFHLLERKVQCADLCCSEPECKSFSLDCTTLTAGVSGQCYLFDTNVDSASDLISSSLCYVQRTEHTPAFMAAVQTAGTTTPTTTPEPTTTTPSSTTYNIPSTTTTAASGSESGNNHTIYDIIYGPLDMCSTGPSSQKDFLVIANDGVYYYNDVADLTVAPCKGPISFETVFSGYSGLNTVDQVSGMLVHQSNVEIYSFATGKVYKWQMNSGTLSKMSQSSYSHQLGLSGSGIEVDDFSWSAYRGYTSQERHFFMGTDASYDFFMVSDQFGEHSFDINESVLNTNNFNMNPWSDIPSDIVAACGYTNDPAKNFILINKNLEVYTYELNHNADNNNPTKAVTKIGTLQFG